jgi:hypothetical protein
VVKVGRMPAALGWAPTGTAWRAGGGGGGRFAGGLGRREEAAAAPVGGDGKSC